MPFLLSRNWRRTGLGLSHSGFNPVGTPGAPGPPGQNTLDRDQALRHVDGGREDVATRSIVMERDNGDTFSIPIEDIIRAVIAEPGGFSEPVITALTFPDIASRIDTTASLVGDHSFSYHVGNHGSIASMELSVNGTEVHTVPSPSTDGTVSGTFNMSSSEWDAIVASDPTNLAFKIDGQDNNPGGAGAFESNTVNIERRTLGPQEYVYWYTNSTDNAAAVDISTTNRVEAVSSYDFNIATSLTAGHLLILLVRNTSDISQIIERTFDIDARDRFTKTTSVRSIGSEPFSSYVLTNNGPTGNVSFRVIGGPA